jgi:hypothetical protein
MFWAVGPKAKCKRRYLIYKNSIRRATVGVRFFFGKFADSSLTPRHFAGGLMARLLKNFLEQQSCPKPKSGLFSSAFNYFFQSLEEGESLHLPEKSVMLMLLLIHQNPSGCENHYLEIFIQMEDLICKIYFRPQWSLCII